MQEELLKNLKISMKDAERPDSLIINPSFLQNLQNFGPNILFFQQKVDVIKREDSRIGPLGRAGHRTVRQGLDPRARSTKVSDLPEL